MIHHWYLVPINPEPWQVGSAGVGRRGGKLVPYIGPSVQLREYQNAIREELRAQTPPKITGPVFLQFYFWRQSASYEGATRRAKRNRPDVTNMQKACEDAIQDILIGNDRDTVHVQSVLVEEGPNVMGKIVIGVAADTSPPRAVYDIPDEVLRLIAKPVMAAVKETRDARMAWGGEDDSKASPL